jgi:GDP-4-dehydro-6-deoxy-D-mannose reductase
MPAGVTGIPLVTGATGFAGSHLVEHLLEHSTHPTRSPHVAAWSHSGGRHAADPNADARVTWTSVDVTDADAVRQSLERTPPSAVYHCAGIADVHGAWTAAARALRVNVIGTHTVLEALDRLGLRVPVIVTGSALVYRPSPDALSEDSPLGPSGPYGVSKLAQEMLADSVSGHVVVARSFNHAGPRQSASYVTSSFARQIAEAEAGRREPVLRVGNLDARRDITDVRDTVRAYRMLLERGQPGQPYNVCRGEAFRVGDLLDVLLTHARVRVRVETDPERLRPSDNPVVLGNPSRIRQDTGWSPRIPIDQTLRDLLEYWRHMVRAQGPASSA